MELVLGTAQFGMDYGITNYAGKISSDEITAILDKAKQANIKVIDTAPSYGKSERELGRNDLSSFEVFTKTPHIQSNEIRDVEIDYVDREFHSSLERLNLSAIEGVFIHNSKDIFKSGAVELFKKLDTFKQEGMVHKIGVSLYDTSEIEYVLEHFDIDIIQIPINIFDQRLIQTDILNKIKSRNIKVFARSIFLQGLLLSNSDFIYSKFGQRFKEVDHYFSCLQDRNIEKLDAIFSFLNQFANIDYALVGISNLNHLEEINRSFEKVTKQPIKHMNFTDFQVNSLNLIDPRRWGK